MAGPGVVAAASRLSLLLLLVAVFGGFSPDSRTEAAVRTCTYTVKVKTSCASPARTSDAVSVAFGDAYRNEAYGARLPPGAFERCGTDTFRVSGVCGYGVCYLYLRRAGRDGWAPEWVQVVEPGPGAGEKPATFYFGAPLPDGVWYGHNRCPKAKASAAARTNTTSTAASPLG
ncbi:embryo-specific protein ATS3A-like [Hordeum vulgare subsp. vulgare]|uniref:Uncharacterized protein n=3 Tax=Hordeum vulgare subsp. vulgare TaxID=112509 RepID=M0VUM7_HORVV|nr:embryo-specific protein ATS3A-like [Hordeum vulgare subsp. vulgare]KAI5021818.1 hypothetical protein ZWY2020_058548 [Hordeum vulgare]